MTSTSISKHDEDILDLVFKGGPGPSENAQGCEKPPSKSPSAQAIAALTPDAAGEMRRNEAKGIELAEKGQHEAAIEAFSKALEICPKNASVYNNRAQTYRMLEKLQEAQHDLNLAIEYGAGDAFVLKQAYTQRAAVGKQLGNTEQSLVDFERGGQFGSEVARIAAVKENPFAQMCNAIMVEVMGQYQRQPEDGVSGSQKKSKGNDGGPIDSQ